MVSTDGIELHSVTGPTGAATMLVPVGPIDLPAGSYTLELRYERGQDDDPLDYDEMFIDNLSICSIQ